jgi:acetoin utilization protein AcuB
MLVADLMTRSPLSIPPEAPLLEAAELLRQHRIRHLPVVREGRVCGILSDRDVKLAMPPPESGSVTVDPFKAYELPVSEIMTTEVITIAPGDSVADAVRLMLRRKISCLPVTQEDHLVGILTETDLLNGFLMAIEEP